MRKTGRFPFKTTMRITCAVVSAVLALALAPLPAAAQAEERCDSAAQQYESASEHLKAEEFYEAIAGFTKVIELDRAGNCEISAKGLPRYNRGLAYSRSGNYDGAIIDLKRAVGQNGGLKESAMPELLKAYRARGSAAFQAGDYEKAIDDFTEVLFLNPDDLDAREARRQVYRERGKARRENGAPVAPSTGSAAGRGKRVVVSSAPVRAAQTNKSSGEYPRGLLPALVAALFILGAFLLWIPRRVTKDGAAASGGSKPSPGPTPEVLPAAVPQPAAPAKAPSAPRGPAAPAGAGPSALEVKSLISEEKYEEARDLLARKKRLGLPDYELFLEIYIKLGDFMRAELTANQIAGALRDGLASDCEYPLYLSLSDECRANGEDALASRLRGIAVDWMLQALSVHDEPKKFQELAEAMEKEGDIEQALKIYRRLAELPRPWPGAAERYKELKKKPAAPAKRPEPPPKTEVQAPSLVIDNRYELKNTLGEGGMGVVFEGWDRQLKRRTAVKRMHSWLKQYPAEYSRFRKEAEIVARLRHPNIIGVHGIVEHGGDIYLVFDFVDGRPLSEVLREKKQLPLKDCLEIFRDVCGAVEHAHNQGVIHRDLKPGNIMMDRSGRAMVMDFGLASELRDSFSRVSHQTVSGTPAYMAPEQHSGVVKRESDIYSLGVCLYEMLTGELPFQGGDILGQKLGKDYREISAKLPWLPSGVDAVMGRALQPEPQQRYAGARELYEALVNL